MSRFVYADNAATSKLSERALAAMMPYLTEHYGNASSLYGIADTARRAIEEARKSIATSIGAKKEEIYFTSGGTESDNWALQGYAHFMKKKGKTHIITSAIEHHAVLHTARRLEKEGFTVTYLPVDEQGLLQAAQVEAAMRPETGLVSIMYANNEIGAIMPIAEIGAICRAHQVVFHTDAVQAVGHIPVDVVADQVDMLSLAAHKFNGPKGVGALYIRRGIVPNRLLEGGGQERGRRPGTENTAAIVGMAQALNDAILDMSARTAHLLALRDQLIAGLLDIPAARLNGDASKRLPGNVNVSFAGIEGESILLMLDLAGICASSGSACTSGSLDPSHVLLGIGLPHSIAHGSVRLSLSHETTAEDVAYILAEMPPIIQRLRSMSPVWDEVNKCMREDENLK